MACESFPLPGGGAAIVCSRNKRRAPCGVPHCGQVHVALCDYPVTRNRKPGTCDMKLCRGHRWPVPGEKDKDYCPAHRKAYQASTGVG